MFFLPRKTKREVSSETVQSLCVRNMPKLKTCSGRFDVSGTKCNRFSPLAFFTISLFVFQRRQRQYMGMKLSGSKLQHFRLKYTFKKKIETVQRLWSLGPLCHTREIHFCRSISWQLDLSGQLTIQETTLQCWRHSGCGSCVGEVHVVRMGIAQLKGLE